MTRFEVLGPLRVVGGDGVEIIITGELQRRLLAALLLRRGRVVTADALTEIVWRGLNAPVGNAALQSLVFRLRQRVAGLDLDHRGLGYALQCDESSVDAVRFEQLVWGAVAMREERPDDAITALDNALALWRGYPYDELIDSDEARIESERLVELQRRAREERFDLIVAGGRAGEVLADLEAFVAAEPLREQPRRVLIDAFAATGRRADALRVYDTYRRLLADELGVAPSTELRRRHDELLAEDDHVASTRPAPDVSRSHTPLRRPSSSLVGRDDVIDELVDRVGSTRLVTLIGPGGVGKTRLALEAAHRLTASFGSRVVFCDLTVAVSSEMNAAAHADGSLNVAPSAAPSVAGVVVGALGVESRADQDDLHRLSDVLRHERALVILDNCEHVLDDVAGLAEHVLSLTDGVVIIATSRERLAVDGENLLAVAPLACNTGEEASPARQLFLERARAVTRFEPDSSELMLLDELCRRLDGLPLAIELAAARLQTLSLREVIDGLDRSLSVLRGGRRTVERHRSVDAALRWSYDLLDDFERLTLHAAACFSATFDADDVAAVIGVTAGEARELLSMLTERSMASRDGERTFLLDIVRLFAREQTSDDERDRLLPRFASRMLVVTNELSAALRIANGATPVHEFTRRLVDFRRAIAVSLDVGDVGLALEIAVDIYELSVTSLTPDLMRMGAEAAAAGEVIGHPLAADGFAVAAMGAWKRGDLDEMRALLVRSEATAAQLDLGDSYLRPAILGVEDLAHGRLESAIARFHRSLHCIESGDPLRDADTRATIAICMSYAHDPAAIDVVDRLVADLGDAEGAITRAWCWYASGECRIDTEPALASDRLERSIGAARLGGSTFVEGVAGASLASIQVRLGDVTAAIRTYRWLLPLWLRSGVRSPFWTAMRSIVDLLARAREDTAAARLLGAVMAPGSGHDVFGDDAARLAAIRDELIGRLGRTEFESSYHDGAGLDDAAAAQQATAAFDRIA